MLTLTVPLRRALHFDPGWMHLRATAVTMATVLGAYGTPRDHSTEEGRSTGTGSGRAVRTVATIDAQLHTHPRAFGKPPITPTPNPAAPPPLGSRSPCADQTQY
ncbi:hypothetical protein [Streptomyces sp. PSAA01]|uniref:hypothetical protein n=1 Tax=Streptomyces sp. PSAA01 TaxID=2912762 RepID=UPI001F404BC7|nr:hypothetical protein [Streptomyces sp. PSAA01]MCG0286864.1 hypothetical protein [Streptomyces sp. PSAA01]